MEDENQNELFKITRYSYVNASITIDDFIANHMNYSRVFGLTGDQIVFQLNEQPYQERNQTFSFRFEFSDSKVISRETSTFEVSNRL